MSKKFVSTLCLILAALLLFGVLAGVLGSAVSAVSQSEIDALESQRDEIRKKQSDVKEQLDSLKVDMASALDKKTALDEQNELNRQDIELIDEQIKIYDGLIIEKKIEVDKAKQAEDRQYERYCQRVRAMEENGNWSYISFIFKADSLSELLSRVYDVLDIVTRDQNVEKEYIAAREHLQSVQAEYEEVQAQQQDKKAELEKEKAELESQIEAASAMIADLEGDIETYTAFYEENEKLESEVQSKIDQKVAQLKAEEAARAAAAAAAAAANQSKNNTSSGSAVGSKDSGYYYWPCQSCTTISSPFGYRVHPIFNTTKFHSGVDIAASYGATISAAASGTVAIAEYSSSYGNYAVIYHSNGTTTLYAHMSSIAVTAGSSISQGDTVGYVGSTGNSTGPHLHFEVRVNGSCVDPLSYFSLNFTYI
jgi:murein DD-endopeptidase MepM/ murein hydrolase activator NlpD